MEKLRYFRIWFYLRTGYQLYFAFIFAGINTMVVTYFLAIDKAPFLKEIFPSFTYYAAVLIVIGLPVLIFTGFIHFKKIPAFKSEQEVAIESNPYQYKLPPGHSKLVVFPWQLLLSQLILKIANNEKLSDDEINSVKKLQKQMQSLIDGEYVGSYPGALKDKKSPAKNEKKNNNK